MEESYIPKEDQYERVYQIFISIFQPLLIHTEGDTDETLFDSLRLNIVVIRILSKNSLLSKQSFQVSPKPGIG